MLVEAHVNIHGTREAIWDIMTDIQGAAKIISGIKAIEVVEKPTTGIVGLKWRETRIYFGDSATVEKQITEARLHEFFKTRAEIEGFLFLSTMSISEANGRITLTSSHDTLPQGIVAKLKAIPMVLFKRTIRKALLQDLNDIKTAVERN